MVIVHWNIVSPKRYDARVESRYSATIPANPVKKIDSFREDFLLITG
ncbi:hypothetical protein JCM13304A_22580 [Desulfothermus okinawensis JCM 13304]